MIQADGVTVGQLKRSAFFLASPKNGGLTSLIFWTNRNETHRAAIFKNARNGGQRAGENPVGRHRSQDPR